MSMKSEVKKYLSTMEIRKRTVPQPHKEGETYVCFTEEAITAHDPYYKRLSEIVNTYQGSEDFAYQQVYNCLNWLNEEEIDIDSNDFEDCLAEQIDSEVDVYTNSLLEWLAGSNYNVYYITEVLEDFGCDGIENDGFKLLMMAQYKAIEEIWQEVVALFR